MTSNPLAILKFPSFLEDALAFESWEKLWKREEKDFNSMWVSEVSNKFTKNEMEIEKPEGIVC